MHRGMHIESTPSLPQQQDGVKSTATTKQGKISLDIKAEDQYKDNFKDNFGKTLGMKELDSLGQNSLEQTFGEVNFGK